ncbi:MAG: hypothetical protein SOU49_12105 [Sodaliphilus pleomorphus]|uniref:hypothetical protein n=1 Tax=Sodaliphilus pleomorphus TaxID=2606626 RepID=UPI002A75A204|nr:hypothetical protein [Sodaliphilus pleomorphus]MDY2833463.1 hypothetical protein [Sodaliphilus pleomorphus]MDY5321884.1 hypothetical protein [Prevotella sp.]
MTKFLSLEGLKTLITKLKSYFAAKNEAIKNITGAGNKTLTYTRADGSTGTINYQDTTYSTGNTSTAGLTKLYTSIGGQTDGAPTNKLLNEQVSALNTAIGKKQDKLTAGQGIKIAGNTISVQVDSTLFVVVTSLPDAPASGNEGKIHLVQLSKTSTNNKYAEYIWRGTTDKWEQLGTISSKMDLSDYSTTEQVKALIKTETDARTAADTAETNARTAADTALGKRISALEGDEDVFVGTAGNAADGFPNSYSGYWLATNDEPFVFKVTNGSPVQVLTIGTFLFNDTATGDWYIVDTGKSTTKVQTSITTDEINALF